ncbi:MAG: flagellar hook-basal body protein [Phycisphaerales bacterium]|nr:flagellar hook-basal body protein [Phycisphaerales bacterium]
MTYGAYLSTAGMQANEYRQNIMANNLANADTHGFKHDLAVFSQRPVASRMAPAGLSLRHLVLDGMSGGLSVRPTYHSFEQGAIEHTGQPLDAAIEGEGFFAVQDGDRVRYTRDGRMTFNAKGELVLTAGEGRLRVLDQSGSPIRRLEGGGEVSITGNGAVQQDGAEIGHIAVASFTDLRRLRKVGSNLFEAGEAEQIPTTATIVPNVLEQSTFDAVKGLTGMIEVQRAYEINARLLTMQDESMGRLIQSVGRVA